MGIGWVREDGASWVTRTSAGPGPCSTEMRLVIGAEARHGKLIFDNWTESGQPAVAVVRDIQVISAEGPNSDERAAGGEGKSR